ncbi:kinase domain-containing protein, partial [Syncephalis fuscata]
KLYAVKEFRKRNPNEDQRKYIKRLTAEYCIASTLHHENIIETLDIVFENNRAYVIMDYCPHDLFYLLASENALFTTDSAVDCYFAQLLQGVGYLHQAGIAHLDLKLENCVVAPNGTLKIIDFGCAEVVRAPWEMRTRQCEKAKGSQPYVAPEVYLSHPFNGQFADAWAVGLTFICMVERHYPWRIARPSTDDAYRRYSEMRSIADASDKAAFAKDEKMEQDSKEPVISGLLCPNASRRWTIAQALDDKWVRQIEICHDQHPATHHRHPGCEGPLIK